MTMQDKPEGAKIGWRVLDISYPFSTPWMKLRQDHVHIEGSGETTYTYHLNAGSVCIVPVTRDGQVILIRQYRYPVDEWCFEVPAGGITGEQDYPSMVELAQAELQEEIGARCEEILHVAAYFPANALSNEVCHVYLALNVEMNRQQMLETTEFIEVHPTPVKTAVKLARTGAIKDGFSALAILMCEDLLRERGYL